MLPLRRLRFAAACSLLLLSAGCATAGLPDKRLLQYLNQEGFGKRYVGDAVEQNYVTIGDRVTYWDIWHEEVRGTEEVDVDGTIQLPEAGRVFVAGMTRSELEAYLTQKLSPYFRETDVKVDIRSGGGKAYFVWGEVEQPGRKIFRGDTTVFEAVLEARPENFTANLGRVKVIRADPRSPLIIPINVAEMWETGDSTYNVQVRENDIVYVPPTILKQFGDFVSGLVVPIVTPFRAILSTIFFFDRGRFDGGRRRF